LLQSEKPWTETITITPIIIENMIIVRVFFHIYVNTDVPMVFIYILIECGSIGRRSTGEVDLEHQDGDVTRHILFSPDEKQKTRHKSKIKNMNNAQSGLVSIEREKEDSQDALMMMLDEVSIVYFT
jgi:hypothetical protein